LWDFQSFWTLVRPCLLSSFGISNEILRLFHYYQLSFFFFPLFSSLLLLCLTFSIEQNDSLFFLIMSLLFFSLFSDTFSFFGFTCSFLTYPQKSLPIFVCPPCSPLQDKTIYWEGLCLFCRVWSHLFVLNSFCLRTIWFGIGKVQKNLGTL